MTRAALPAALALTAALAGCGREHARSRLQLSGNFEVLRTELSFRVAGKVLERPVDEGQTVQEGQLVARLDARDLEQQVALREADAAAARAVLAALQKGSRREEIEAARAVLAQAAAELKRLEPDEARLRDLHQKGILSTRDYEAGRAAFQAAQARVRQAEQQAALVQQGPRQEDLDAGKARYEQARQALELAKTQLGYATLVAPGPGLVLSKNVEPKEYVAPGTSVITLGDLRALWLRAYVEETDLGRVKVGQKALLRTDSFPGRTYEGRVSFISAEAEFTPKSVQTRKERVKLVYRIKIDVPNPAQELKPGMPADAELLLAEGR